MRHLPDHASPHDGLLREVRHRDTRTHRGRTQGVVRDRGGRGDQRRRSRRIWRRWRRQRRGHDRESAGPAAGIGGPRAAAAGPNPLDWEEKRSRRLEEEGGWGGGGDDDNDAYGSSVLLSSDSLPTGGGATSAALSSSVSLQDGTESRSNADASHNILRPISLLQAINADDLPETVQIAFGDAPVREGGPVNLSLQMIHRRALETRGDERDGGANDAKAVERGGGNRGQKASKIGGTMLGYERGGKPKDSGDAICFGGDVMEASYAVLDGTSDRDDFSFVIGAACWAPGQLEHEIERGCWLPFTGPPTMALTGMCEHNDVPESERDGENNDKGTKLSQFPPRPSNIAKAEFRQSSQPVTRPVGDLWLSVMCALGEGEADLAFMMTDEKNVEDAFGDACDNFER